MAFAELYATGQNSVTLKSKDLATRGFPKKFQTHSPKPAEAETNYKVSLPCKTMHTLPRSPLG